MELTDVLAEAPHVLLKTGQHRHLLFETRMSQKCAFTVNQAGGDSRMMNLNVFGAIFIVIIGQFI